MRHFGSLILALTNSIHKARILLLLSRSTPLSPSGFSVDRIHPPLTVIWAWSLLLTLEIKWTISYKTPGDKESVKQADLQVLASLSAAADNMAISALQLPQSILATPVSQSLSQVGLLDRLVLCLQIP